MASLMGPMASAESGSVCRPLLSGVGSGRGSGVSRLRLAHSRITSPGEVPGTHKAFQPIHLYTRQISCTCVVIDAQHCSLGT